jgi:hypothetical protein
MAKKYQIFISSTFTDLRDERQDAVKAILDLDQIPSGMEVFPAADQEQFEYIKQVIDECDYYVLIIGARYGSVDEQGVSYTEREYDYARESGKTVLAFLHDDPSSIPVGKVDTDPDRVQRLVVFREKVSSGRLVKFWRTKQDLQAAITVSLSRAIRHSPAIGWIRGNAAASEELLTQMNALRNEADVLRQENERLRSLQAPALENIAGLEDTFQVRYTHWVAATRHSPGFRQSGQVDLTWKEIFRAVSPRLIRPATPSLLDEALTTYLNENNMVPASIDIMKSDLNTIKIHLAALNLITVEAGQTAGGGVNEFLSLSPAGRARMFEILAVRRASSAPAAAVGATARSADKPRAS